MKKNKRKKRVELEVYKLEIREIWNMLRKAKKCLVKVLINDRTTSLTLIQSSHFKGMEAKLNNYQTIIRNNMSLSLIAIRFQKISKALGNIVICKKTKDYKY